MASSSSSSTTSFGKVGFVGWYLGMVKSWPVLTKSVTSSLIYTAADFLADEKVEEKERKSSGLAGNFTFPLEKDAFSHQKHGRTCIFYHVFNMEFYCQIISKSSAGPYDLVRTSRMAGYGLLILGPSLHFWFNLMLKLFPKRDLITTFKKMAMGQLLFGPFMTVVFFSLNACLQGMFLACHKLNTALHFNSYYVMPFPCMSRDKHSEPFMNRATGSESGEKIVSKIKRDLLPTMLNGVMYWPFCDFITFRFVPVHLQPLVSNSFSYLWTVYMTYMASLEKPVSVTC
ncbi:hypothetical protein F3Y22_tig00008289pilonHSYRG00084 [Hibiscus syriacus]|uniref:Uncharacterized protein n=1 Tax=Hibiscus syriacus TaxID=106335 RepID=A0A6A3C8R5_HIBSY|nr:hypothetical protein F3Y22_tig00008289pilonHSYRG00084 [Hibiscus syriacus]